MSAGWILDTGAVYDADRRSRVVGLVPAIVRKGLRVVLPEHVLLELARQEQQHRRKEARRLKLDPDQVKPESVFMDLEDELRSLERLSFRREDGLALLEWLSRPGVESYERASSSRRR